MIKNVKKWLKIHTMNAWSIFNKVFISLPAFLEFSYKTTPSHVIQMKW